MRRFPDMTNSGIYNCRNARGGGSLSEHAEGRAWDCGTRPGNPNAQRIADLLVTHGDALGLQSVIYNRRVWGYGRWNWRAYSGYSVCMAFVFAFFDLFGPFLASIRTLVRQIFTLFLFLFVHLTGILNRPRSRWNEHSCCWKYDGSTD